MRFNVERSALIRGEAVQSALIDHAIPHVFPKETLEEAARLPLEIETHHVNERIDLRKHDLITIDGESARDFDDAVCCKQNDQGGWTLWVAIADVSSYVPVGSALDAEARLRGTSVYFPRHVVPMLPKNLSNGLCSLVPDVDRLCLVCELEINKDGVVNTYRFYEALMCSKRRFSYNEVADLLGLEDREASTSLRDDCTHLLDGLHALHRLYQALAKRRRNRGAIDFDASDYAFYFDNKDTACDIRQLTRNHAHRLIEECMLAANVAAAQFLAEHQLRAPYRVHPPPSKDNLEELRTFLGSLGINLSIGAETAHVQNILTKVAGRPEAPLVNMMVLRAMSKAIYTTDNEGHFGLCYAAYTHFTSPIRRYPDLLVHRAIRSVIRDKGADDLFPYAQTQMSELCMHSSDTERRAEDATRKVNQQLACSFLLRHLGDEFDGIITGVTHFGLFIHLSAFGVDGLAHISEMDGYFHYEEARQRLVLADGSKSYRLGDVIHVRLTQIQPEAVRINMHIL